MKLEESPESCGGHCNPGLALEASDPSPHAIGNVHRDGQNTAVKRSSGSVVAAKESVVVEDSGPDGGWGWVVAGAASATWCLSGITGYNFGMLFSGFLLEMGTTTTFVAWIYSLGLVVSCLISAVMDPLVAAFGWRRVAVAMGAVYSVALMVSAFATSALFLFFSSFAAGMMVDCLQILSCAIVPHYFTRRRHLANNIVAFGTSVNFLSVPHLLTYLHAEYGFRGAILITGGLCLHLIPAGLVYHPVQWHYNNTEHGPNIDKAAHTTTSKSGLLWAIVDASKSNFMLFKSPRAVIIIMAYGVYYSGSTFVSSYLPFAMQATGYTLRQTAHCLTVVGVFNLAARFVYPWVVKACRGDAFPIAAVSFGLIPVSIVAFACVNVLAVKAAAMAVYGVANSFVSSTMCSVIVDKLGLPLLLPMLCMISVAATIGYLTIGPVTGAVRDLTGSYTFSLYVPAAFTFLLSFLPCTCMRAANRYQHHTQERLLLNTQTQKSSTQIPEKKSCRFTESSRLLAHKSSSSIY